MLSRLRIQIEVSQIIKIQWCDFLSYLKSHEFSGLIHEADTVLPERIERLLNFCFDSFFYFL